MVQTLVMETRVANGEVVSERQSPWVAALRALQGRRCFSRRERASGVINTATKCRARLSYNRVMKSDVSIPNEICAKIDLVWGRLREHYGYPKLKPTGNPLEQLVRTILSQHTTDASAGRAYEELRARFHTWSDIASAPLADIAEAIRFSGLARQKALTIQTALRELGDIDLRGLTDMPVPEARATLTSIRGIGDKTASCVLLFALGMPAQPVDTHIERVSKRLGIDNRARTATGIQHLLESCLPSDGATMFAFHVDLIRHGRQVCTARAPKCSMCVLNDICDFHASTSLEALA